MNIDTADLSRRARAAFDRVREIFKKYPRHYTIPAVIGGVILVLALGHAMLAGQPRATATPVASAPAASTPMASAPAPRAVTATAAGAVAPVMALIQPPALAAPQQKPAAASASTLRPPAGVKPGHAEETVEAQSGDAWAQVSQADVVSPGMSFENPPQDFSGNARVAWTAWVYLAHPTSVVVITATGSGSASVAMDGVTTVGVTANVGQQYSNAAAAPLGAGWHKVDLSVQPGWRRAQVAAQLALGDGTAAPVVPVPYAVPVAAASTGNVPPSAASSGSVPPAAAVTGKLPATDAAHGGNLPASAAKRGSAAAGVSK
ncbi:MAG TPA: hypothetical protein VFQ95_00270 [Rhodanobacteraceae bacterium]|nr:hypothetical protein [Rhodanobacteraceae bacterium]